VVTEIDRLLSRVPITMRALYARLPDVSESDVI